jgi:hypothetical protein
MFEEDKKKNPIFVVVVVRSIRHGEQETHKL